MTRFWREDGKLRLLLGLVLLGPVLLSAGAAPSWAWGPAGHRVVARIAESQLSKQALSRYQIVAGKGASLVEAANWADEIIPERPVTARWHSIAFRPGSVELKLERDCPFRECITAKMREFVGVARLAMRPPVERYEALRFVIHLMGDLHQPLRAGYPAGLEGREIPVVFNGQRSDLGRFWETGLLDMMIEDEAAFSERLIAKLKPADRKNWSQGRLQDWTWESHLVAVRFAYGTLPEGETKVLEADYIQRLRPIVEEQLMKAGVRLAAVFNEIWGLEP